MLASEQNAAQSNASAVDGDTDGATTEVDVTAPPSLPAAVASTGDTVSAPWMQMHCAVGAAAMSSPSPKVIPKVADSDPVATASQRARVVVALLRSDLPESSAPIPEKLAPDTAAGTSVAATPSVAIHSSRMSPAAVPVGLLIVTLDDAALVTFVLDRYAATI
jgi:hypothetical protein